MLNDRQREHFSDALTALAKCYECVTEIRHAIRQNDSVETQNLLFRLCQRIDKVREPILAIVSSDQVALNETADKVLEVL